MCGKKVALSETKREKDWVLSTLWINTRLSLWLIVSDFSPRCAARSGSMPLCRTTQERRHQDWVSMPWITTRLSLLYLISHLDVWQEVALNETKRERRARTGWRPCFGSTPGSVPDPNPPDPHVFGPPGSGSRSMSQRYGSGFFYHHAKIESDSFYFVILFDFLSLKNYVNVPSKQKKLC
jgi:hypothetical protein